MRCVRRARSAPGVSARATSICCEHFNASGDCDVLQIDYSILNRTAEQEILPYCAANGIGVIVRGPIAMGLLAGKYRAGDTFPDGDFRANWINDPVQNEQFLRDLAVVDDLRSIVPERADAWRSSRCASCAATRPSAR